MTDPRMTKILEMFERNKPAYIDHITNLENEYDKDTAISLLKILELNRDNIDILIHLITERINYLDTISYETTVVFETHPQDKGGNQYFVYLSMTPKIDHGEEHVVTRPGLWFNDDIDQAKACAEAIAAMYECGITKVVK
jgi:hypothetical protein